MAHVSHRLVPRLNKVTSASPRRRWRILLPHPPAITVRASVCVDIAALDVRSPDGGLLPASMRPLDGGEGGGARHMRSEEVRRGSKGFRIQKDSGVRMLVGADWVCSHRRVRWVVCRLFTHQYPHYRLRSFKPLSLSLSLSLSLMHTYAHSPWALMSTSSFTVLLATHTSPHRSLSRPLNPPTTPMPTTP